MTATSTDHRQRLARIWARTYGPGKSTDKLPIAKARSRPLADANAAWRRWHDAALSHNWSAAEWPWFLALERARVEQLAGQHLPGMARNLSDLEQIAPHLPLTADLYRAARDVFAGETNPQQPIFSQ